MNLVRIAQRNHSFMQRLRSLLKSSFATEKPQQLSEQMAQKKVDDVKNDTNDMFATYEKRIIEFEKNADIELPVDNNRIITDAWKPFRPQILKHMNECYPLVHGSVLSLADDFLRIKLNYGSDIEKALYKDMSIQAFLNRLATKRCVVFYQGYDAYTLRNGYNSNGKWENIGTEKENDVDKYDTQPELLPKLAEYLSYDELVISALCGISSPTHFINDGDRRNCGRIAKDSFGKGKEFPLFSAIFYVIFLCFCFVLCHSEGIYMGLVGARFEKSQFMEYSLMAITDEQNTEENGYGAYAKEEKENDVDMDNVDALKRAAKSENKQIWRAFEKFYCRKYFPTFNEIKNKYDAADKVVRARYYQKGGYYGQNQNFLDCDLFRQRIRIGIELFLFDADRRAAVHKKEKNTKSGAFCHIVGLGTGVWSFAKAEQDRIIVHVTRDVVKKTHLPNIDKIYFAWMHGDSMNVSEDNEESIFGKEDFVLDKSNEHKIFVESGKRSPADEFDAQFKDCLNVSMYAWDSNSFPGNEYYLGMLSASGDPAAASCSTISYVQNSEINKENINGANSGIYFYDPQTQKYSFYKMKDIDFEQNKEKWLKMSRNCLPSKR